MKIWQMFVSNWCDKGEIYRNNAIFATNLLVSFPCFGKKKDGFKTGLPNKRKVLFVFATVDEEFAQQEICEKFDWQIHSAVTAR
jgi:hypothetical protein